ncbi:13858_t:CDS:2, partial [Racocetra fulgida]
AETVSTEDSNPPASEIPQTSEAPPEAANDDSKKDKKKKKNKSTKEEEKKAPAKKKPPIAAIRAQLEAQRIAEEERKRQEEEEQKRVEERLKKEGKYLNPAQKAKMQQAQKRLQQMIESGYKIEGLDKDGEQKTKKVVYSNKKKPPTKHTSDKTEVDDTSKSKVGDNSVSLENTEDEKKIDANKDTKEEDEEIENNRSIEIKDNIKDQWDASSSDEEDDVLSDDEKISTNDVETPPTAPIKADTAKKQELPTKADTAKKQESPTITDTAKKQEPPTKAGAAKKQEPVKDESESGEDETESEDIDEDSDEESDNEKVTERQKQRNQRKAEAAERTPILMYDGHIKAVETIKEGDQVMGDDSTPRNVKLYPFRSTDYTINNAKQIAIRDLELLNKVENLSSSGSNSRISIVRPGFIWQPSVTQFLNCDPEVQSQAKMFIPEKVRFPSQEGTFAKIVESIIDIHSSPAIIKLCAWLVGFWIGTNAINKHKKGHLSGHSGEIMTVYRILYSEYKVANRNLLFRLLQELDILIDKDIPEVMMLDDIIQVRLPLLSGIICSFGESQDKIARV